MNGAQGAKPTGSGREVTPGPGGAQDTSHSMENYIGFLKDQSKDLNENLKSALTLYTAWYNFFITLNAVALGFASDKGPRSAVALVFLILNLLGSASCLIVRSMATSLTAKLHTTREELWRRVALIIGSDASSGAYYFETVSASVISWSIIGNFLGVVLFQIIWLYILLVPKVTK